MGRKQDDVDIELDAVNFKEDWEMRTCPKCRSAMKWEPIYNYPTDHLIVQCGYCKYSYRMLPGDREHSENKSKP